jgi:hypothetical protein
VVRSIGMLVIHEEGSLMSASRQKALRRIYVPQRPYCGEELVS